MKKAKQTHGRLILLGCVIGLPAFLGYGLGIWSLLILDKGQGGSPQATSPGAFPASVFLGAIGILALVIYASTRFVESLGEGEFEKEEVGTFERGEKGLELEAGEGLERKFLGELGGGTKRRSFVQSDELFVLDLSGDPSKVRGSEPTGPGRSP